MEKDGSPVLGLQQQSAGVGREPVEQERARAQKRALRNGVGGEQAEVHALRCQFAEPELLCSRSSVPGPGCPPFGTSRALLVRVSRTGEVA